jgi:hypothetical protein
MSGFHKVLLLAILIIAISSCSTNTPQATVEPNLQKDHNETTAQSFQILELDIYTPTVTIIYPSLTPTLAPTATAIENNQEGSTNLAASQTPIEEKDTPTPSCTNQAEFMKILNLGEYTQLKTGEAFARIWRIKNSGTCTWSTSYQLILIEGDPMGSPERIAIPIEVKPGDVIDLRIDGFAPIVPDDYFSKWLFQDTQGKQFGLGTNSDEPLIINLIVNQYTELYDPDPPPT